MENNETGHRLSAEELEARLAESEMFGMLDGAALHEVASELAWVRLHGGETLFRQRDEGDGLYLVISGRLRVYIERGGIEEALTEVGRGEMVGEMAVLTSERRSATVRAVRDTELVKFSTDACHRVTEKYPRILFLIARVIARRLEAMNRSLRVPASVATIALLPINREVRLSEFAAQLSGALSGLGTTLHLKSEVFDQKWGQQGAAQTPVTSSGSNKIANWLNDQENQYRYVLYETDAELSHWTQRCIRQADRILSVGNGGPVPELSALEHELLAPGGDRTTASMELVLVHPEGTRLGVYTSRWLESRRVTRHYHVRESSIDDFARLARILTGHAVGVVLGGGGVRGFAHIGAIQALREAGIPIDFIGGASMGSIVAAQYALGWDHDAMVKMNRKMFKESWPMNDYTLPLISALSGRKFDETLKALYEDTHIEDLLLNFFCVSTNLTTASLAVHQDGLLWRRVRASCSLPGIVPPEFDNGNMLVDGAVLNNVPGDVMKKLCGGEVIAIDVSPREDMVFKAHYTERPVTRRILWEQINPFSRKISLPSLFDIVSRAAMISSISNTSLLKSQMDLYLHLPLDQFGMSESRSFDKIIEVGYRSAREQLVKWRESRTPTHTLG